MMTAAAPLDLAFVRSQFPALADNQWAYFDNAGGAQVLKFIEAKQRLQPPAGLPPSNAAAPRASSSRA